MPAPGGESLLKFPVSTKTRYYTSEGKSYISHTIRNVWKACGLVPYNPKVVLDKLPNLPPLLSHLKHPKLMLLLDVIFNEP